MSDFEFKLSLVAGVRVRAAGENAARRVVLTIVGAPSAAEIRLANQNIAAMGLDATIIDVDFSVEKGSIKLVEIDGKSDLNRTRTAGTCGAPATHSRPLGASYRK